MMFCPKCGSILKPKMIRDKKVMSCSCGYTDNKLGAVTLTETKKDEIRMDVVETEASVNPIVNEDCPKCKNNKAYTWFQQMRAGDEPETHFFKCTKCSHTWRERK